MQYLLDTHILLWLLFEPEKLSLNARNMVSKNSRSCYISGITFFEISLKFGLAKLDFGILKPIDIYNESVQLGFRTLEINSADMVDFYKLPQNLHKDPFDKMIVWQAIKNNLVLITQDEKLEVYKKSGLKIEL